MLPSQGCDNHDIGKCPFGHSTESLDSIDHLPGASINAGLGDIKDAFLKEHKSILKKSYTPEIAQRKKWQFLLHQKRLLSFLEQHESSSPEGASCPFQVIYDKARASAEQIIGREKIYGTCPEIIGWLFIQEFREMIKKQAELFIQPKNVLDLGISDNIMGPLAPWECTIMSIVKFYGRPEISPDSFLKAWTTIVHVNSIIGIHLATNWTSFVGNELIRIIGDSRCEHPYLSISMGADNDVTMMWREGAIADIIGRLCEKDWVTILNGTGMRRGPINRCPAALVKTDAGPTVIEMGVEKVGNSIYQALFGNK